MKCTIAYDNVSKGELKKGWGFSCFIEAHDKKVLFDTAWDGEELLHNLEKLSINPRELDFVVISHDHWDHNGGLAVLLNRAPQATVLLPSCSADELKDEVARKAKLTVVSSPASIVKGFWTTGELGSAIPEQSLVVECEGGNAVICGCAHPGLEVILNAASEFGNVKAVIGGFHGFSNLELLEGIRLISPCHCTQRKKQILEKFSNSSTECFSGKIIEV